MVIWHVTLCSLVDCSCTLRIEAALSCEANEEQPYFISGRSQAQIIGYPDDFFMVFLSVSS
jgi:hypothetical protein